MKLLRTFGSWLCVLALFAAGCAHEPPDEPGRGGPGGGGGPGGPGGGPGEMGGPGGMGGPGREGPPPGGPPFLSGPIGAVWPKSVEGFVAHVTLDIHTPEGKTDTLSGQLMGQGRKLLFTPEATGARGKRMKEAKISFLWDVTDRQGYILSEALQGCAPLVVTRNYALAQAPSSGAAGSEKIDGHPCQVENVTATSSDGNPVSLRVWTAPDLRGLPVQVAIQPELGKPIFHLTKIHQATPPPEVFEVPDGFSKYHTPDAMLAELRLRQQGAKRKRPEPEMEKPPGGSPNNNPTRAY